MKTNWLLVKWVLVTVGVGTIPVFEGLTSKRLKALNPYPANVENMVSS